MRKPHFLSGLSESIDAKLQLMPYWRLRLLYASPELHKSPKELYRDAMGMTEAGLVFFEQCEVLQRRFSGYYRMIEDREIENAINSALGVTSGSKKPGVIYPDLNLALRQEAIESSSIKTVQQLKDLSQVSKPGELSSEAVLDLFFAPEELVCMGESKQLAYTARRIKFRGKEEDHPFIVTNAMKAEWALNSLGRPSARCNNNVGPMLRLVVEFDEGTLDEQAAIIGNLMDKGVVVQMVLWSGGKSLHSWVDISQNTEAEKETILRYVAALGADKAMFIPCQLCRTPNAIRKENGTKQEVYFLNVSKPKEQST